MQGALTRNATKHKYTEHERNSQYAEIISH